MQHVPEESREGRHDVYYTDAGERLVVLEGLNPEARIEHYPVQEYLMPRVDRVEMIYWLLLFCVASFLLYTNIIAPLFRRTPTH